MVHCILSLKSPTSLQAHAQHTFLKACCKALKLAHLPSQDTAAPNACPRASFNRKNHGLTVSKWSASRLRMPDAASVLGSASDAAIFGDASFAASFQAEQQEAQVHVRGARKQADELRELLAVVAIQ